MQALTDAISQLLMVCGTLLAVANGFIPSFSAMIYGGLTDELVSRVGNCTPLESLYPEMRLTPKVNITNVTRPETKEKETLGAIQIRTYSLTKQTKTVKSQSSTAPTSTPALIALPQSATQIKSTTELTSTTARISPTKTTAAITTIKVKSTTELTTTTVRISPTTTKPMKIITTLKPSTPVPEVERERERTERKKEGVEVVIVGRVKEKPKIKPFEIKEIKKIKEIKGKATNEKEKQANTDGTKPIKLPETKNNFDDYVAKGERKDTTFIDDGVDIIETKKMSSGSAFEIEDFGSLKQEPLPSDTLDNETEIKSWKFKKGERKLRANLEYSESGDTFSHGYSLKNKDHRIHKRETHPSWIMRHIKKTLRNNSGKLFAHLYITDDTLTWNSSFKPTKVNRTQNIRPNHPVRLQSQNNKARREVARMLSGKSKSVSFGAGKIKRRAFALKTRLRNRLSLQTNLTSSSVFFTARANVTEKEAVSMNVTSAKKKTAKHTKATNNNVTNEETESINMTSQTFTNVTHTRKSRIVDPTIAVNIKKTRSNVKDGNVTSTNATRTKRISSDPTVGSRNENVINATLVRTVNATLLSANITLCLTDEEIEQKMKKYAIYYLYAALATLFCAYGEVVCWNIATERGVKKVDMDLSVDVLNKGPELFDTHLHEGTLPSLGIR